MPDWLLMNWPSNIDAFENILPEASTTSEYSIEVPSLDTLRYFPAPSSILSGVSSNCSKVKTPLAGEFFFSIFMYVSNSSVDILYNFPVLAE